MQNTKSKETESHEAKPKGSNGDSLLDEFFLNSLKDINWAENNLIKAIPKTIEASTTEELRKVFEEQLTKKEWNDNVPVKLRSAYNQSIYKNQKVTGYWEVTDPYAKGYYLELNDNLNKPSQVWMNV